MTTPFVSRVETERNEGGRQLRIAALMTCHNRRDSTLLCLEALARAAAGAAARLGVETYLVDDGSTDGTAAAVRARFPKVQVIPGTGSLFWCGGMRLAWQTAAEHDFDSYLWLNDDVALDADALCRLLVGLEDRLQAGHGPCIIVGSTRHPDLPRGRPSYGGLGTDGVMPSEDVICRIEYFNGNVVVVPRATFNILGPLSAAYTHGLADIDYGVRAKQKGVRVWLVPGVVGSCSDNGVPLWQRRDVSLWKRLVALHRPTGCPPWQMARLIWLNGGWWFPWSVLKLYCTAISPPRPKVLA